MSVINTNVMSLNTQLNLSRSQSALGTAIERLSSGMRINSAKDDAAGQAIANRFTSNIKGLAQARRNAMDGISIAQTTEGALNEINNNLQRVRELSVQAANGSNSKSDLDSIQAEVSQRLSEIDRISDQTQFNGKKVLAEDSVLKLQVGAYDSETIDVNLVKTNVQELGLKDFNINAITPAAVVDTPTAIVDADVAGLQTVLGNSNTGVKAAGVSFTIDGTNFGLAAGAATTDGVFKDANGDFYVGVSFAGATGEDLTKLEAAGLDTANTFYLKLPVSGTTVTGTNEANAGDGDGTLAIAFGSSQVSLSSVVADTNFVSTQPARTENPLAAIDNALKTIDTLRGDLGAVQNRLESTITNLGTAVNNLSASRSRIEDADYAVEVSNMSRAQILQQAGTSVLAQANQVPQTVLSLLR